MGAAKDMWMEEIEIVGEDYFTGRIERDEAVARLVRLGLDRHEAETMVDEAKQ